MTQQGQALRSRLSAAAPPGRGYPAAALALALAGACFALYPAIRPFSDETTLRGAQAFASTSWQVAHTLAMAAFILLTLGLWGLHARLRGSRGGGMARAGLLLTAAGTGLTLPYYGAENFGLHAVGQQALQRHDQALLVSLTHGIRWEEGIWFIVPGLLLIGAGMILSAAAVWSAGTPPRWAAILLAAGFALYLPQFTAPQPVRVAHGLLITVGCGLLAWTLARQVPGARGRPGGDLGGKGTAIIPSQG
jgi:hypothetical protein